MKKTLAKSKPKKVPAIPKGYNSIIPYLIIENAASAINFYKKLFGAKEKFCMEYQAGTIFHTELELGDSKIMLSDECLERSAYSPKKQVVHQQVFIFILKM